MRLKNRIPAAAGVFLMAGATLLVTPTPARAADDAAVSVSDIVTFSGRTVLGPAGAGGARPFVIFSDTCRLVSDGESATSCHVFTTGTLGSNGSGTARAVVSSNDGVIVLDVTFQATGPITGTATGTGTEFDARGVTPVTFTSLFSNTPTGNPNVLSHEATVVVREQSITGAATHVGVEPAERLSSTAPTGPARGSEGRPSAQRAGMASRHGTATAQRSDGRSG